MVDTYGEMLMHYMYLQVLYAESVAHAPNNLGIIRNVHHKSTRPRLCGRDILCFSCDTRKSRWRQRDLSDGDIVHGTRLRHVRGDI